MSSKPPRHGCGIPLIVPRSMRQEGGSSDALPFTLLKSTLGAMAGAMAAVVVLCGPVSAADLPAAPEAVYFGNGCFWGRQYDYVQTELSMGREEQQLSAVAGYAGGRAVGPDGKVCYVFSDPRTVYERLGHAEVVQLQLSASNEAADKEFRGFAKTYFSQFRPSAQGMQRLDPQDSGPGYRNVIGLAGGTGSPLYHILQEENVNKMELREGSGGEYLPGQRKATEEDLVNVVWVVDSTKLPFNRAERYHQYHNGIGEAFPKSYRDLKATLADRIEPTGCPELPF
eukprot:CAMPEP_0119107442 /NCGR_PEP_ID=MMETSP1180-20130426/10152_1 /TAXON_ID=3052 ORGANISM="Chlamydomonas cf sp, Strain CCMP681" /NCGR_SAMPLE_ID=MMETSP1180 /ASSEMBLY_ACC=CAM_ASM_000741 /LENGTH=283 /DNA_ID=CAMNT_0007092929 /DNA_START=115 /DNA_END=966 /DNA_ORIENTATION=+